jgi:hypothetical protein
LQRFELASFSAFPHLPCTERASHVYVSSARNGAQ